jgi:hypothetical protein
MRTPRLPSLANLPHRFRERIESLPDDWRTFREQLQANPAAIWESPVVRFGGLAILLILAGWALTWLVGGLTPGGSAARDEATPWATVYVACTNPECQAAYQTTCPMEFDDWPMTCEKCGQETVYRATRCGQCRKWYAEAPGTATGCPHCAARKARQQADAPARRERPTGDDAEDPW